MLQSHSAIQWRSSASIKSQKRRRGWQLSALAGAFRGLRPGEIQEHHIRKLLHSFEDNFTSVWRDVEVANVEVGSEVGQLVLCTRLQVDQPKILVLNLSSQEHQRSSSRKNGEVSSSPSEGKGGQGTHYGLGCYGFQRKGRADVGSRVDNEVAVGRPRWRSLQVQRIADNPRVGAVRLHDIQRGLTMLADGECDVPSVGRDCRPAKDLRSLAPPQFCSSSIGELPYTFADARRRNI